LRISDGPSYILTERGSGAIAARHPRSIAISAHPKRSRYRVWFWAAGLLALAAAAYLALSWREQAFDWKAFWTTFRRLDPWYMAGAVGFALSTYVGRALRWRVLIRTQTRSPNVGKLFVATAIGFTAIVLFGRPGEMVRPYLIAKTEKLPFSSQLGAWLIERIYDLLMALFIFSFALAKVHSIPLPAASEGLKWVMSVGGEAALALTLVCTALLFLFGRYSEAMERRLREALQVLPDRLRYRVTSMTAAFVRGLESCRSLTAVGKVLAYSVLEWVLIILSYYLIFLAVPETGGFTVMQIAIFVGFVSFGSVVQIPGVGGGLQIVSVLVLTQIFGLRLETASGIAVILWAVTFLVIVPVGILLALREGIRLGRLKMMGEELTHEFRGGPEES
jgi:uncharacterized protein (TIRG00374 family)